MTDDPPHGARSRRTGRRARTEDEPVPVGEALAAVADRLGAGPSASVAIVFGRWAQLVGSNVAAHVRPLRLDHGTLVVGADHPAWATQLRQLAPQILDRLREACGEDGAPQRLEVRVMR